MSHDIFIANSALNESLAMEVVAALQQAGESCWISPRDILPGESPDESTFRAIEASQLMVVIFSSGANHSRQVIREIEHALKNHLVLIVFSIEDLKPSVDMQHLLGSAHWLDAVTPQMDLHLEELVSVVNSSLARESMVSSSPPDSETDETPQNRPATDAGLFERIIDGSRGGIGALGGFLGGLLGSRSVSRNGGPPDANGNRDSRPTRSLPESVDKPQAERRLQADITLAATQAVGEPQVLTQAFVAGKDHLVKLSVGRGASLQLNVGFNEPDFSDNSDFEVLELRLIHKLTVASGSIELPKDTACNSSVWAAKLQVPSDAEKVEATVVVLHKGRVLQTAILQGSVKPAIAEAGDADDKIKLTVSADVHDLNHLEGRGTFDASIVTDGKTGAAFAGASVGVRDLKGVDQTIDRMTDKLFKTTEAVTITSTVGDPAEYQKLLVFLAANGKVLHSVLIQQLLPSLDKAHRIQIVSTNPSALLPLEFVFSGPSPKANATLCDGWQLALQTGVCLSCAQLPGDERSDTICPLHFWALSKIIERHAPAEPAADNHDFFVDTRVVGERKQLAPLQHALFAASDNVPEALVDTTLAVLRSMVATLDDARTWADWVSSVRNNSPSLLVSMPHNALDPILEIGTLEIGNGDDLRAGEVTRKYVCNETSQVGPLVLLLGCQTANGGPQPFHTFVGEFRHSGAAIVIGTLATVLGEHAAPIVQAIIKELAKPAKPGENTVGDLLLRIRRKMFAEGILIALAVAAFGDADWALAAPED